MGSIALRTCILLVVLLQHAAAQQPGLNAIGLNPGGVNPGGPAAGVAGINTGAEGGAANADFDSLIDLIVSTVATETWAETGGGDAEIRPFPNGVWLDPTAVVRQARPAAVKKPSRPTPRPAVAGVAGPATGEPRRPARLRCVSLPRLEAEILRRAEAGAPLEEAMLALAGIRRVERLFVYPPDETGRGGDLVIAGPAGDWRVDEEARLVAADTGDAIPRLDDLLVLLRREWSAPGTPLGCSITPRRENLAATQRYLDRTGQKPLPPGRRPRRAWLEGVRSSLGRQDVEVWGIDPATNAARALVEADHHMKQVGLGAADAVEGVESYMDRVADAAAGGQPVSPMNVVRWWFATDYEGVARSDAGDAYRITGRGARVLSENELLTVRGDRVHTGRSDAATEGFAEAFTARFADLCRTYPVYGELRNVFDLAVLAALMRAEGLPERAGWSPSLFLQPGRLPTPRLRAAREVDTLAVSRVVNRTQVLAAVSGGVWVDAEAVLAARPPSTSPPRRPELPVSPDGGWWWDAAP